MTTQVLPAAASIVDLRNLNARDLDPLLNDQTAEWQRALEYDFSGVAALVRQLLQAGKLNGAALVSDGKVAGYGFVYLVGSKACIADVYVKPAWRGREGEARLFAILFRALVEMPGILRVECQPPFGTAAIGRGVTGDFDIGVLDRVLMGMDLPAFLPPGKVSSPARFRIDAWADHHRSVATALVWSAYRGHVDARINDAYLTPTGVRKLIADLTEANVCGEFCDTASYVAFEAGNGECSGICLASFVAPGIGHISQICVAGEAKGAGLGYELLRKCAGSLHAAGARRLTLTVTAANDEALRFYQRCGFHERRRFPAFTWVRPEKQVRGKETFHAEPVWYSSAGTQKAKI